MNSLQGIQEFYTNNILNNLSNFLIKNNEKIEEYKKNLSDLEKTEIKFTYTINNDGKVDISNADGSIVETVDNVSLLSEKLAQLNKAESAKKDAINKKILAIHKENELINEIINKQNFSFTLASHGKTVEVTFDSENLKIKKFLQQKAKTLISEVQKKEDDNSAVTNTASTVVWTVAVASAIDDVEASDTNTEQENVLTEDIVLDNNDIKEEDNVETVDATDLHIDLDETDNSNVTSEEDMYSEESFEMSDDFSDLTKTPEEENSEDTSTDEFNFSEEDITGENSEESSLEVNTDKEDNDILDTFEPLDFDDLIETEDNSQDVINETEEPLPSLDDEFDNLAVSHEGNESASQETNTVNSEEATHNSVEEDFDFPDFDDTTSGTEESENVVDEANTVNPEETTHNSMEEDLDFPDFHNVTDNSEENHTDNDWVEDSFDNIEDDLDLPSLEDDTISASEEVNASQEEVAWDDLDFPDLEAEDEGGSTIIHNHYSWTPEQSNISHLDGGNQLNAVQGSVWVNAAWAASLGWVVMQPLDWSIGGTNISAETININTDSFDLDTDDLDLPEVERDENYSLNIDNLDISWEANTEENTNEDIPANNHSDNSQWVNDRNEEDIHFDNAEEVVAVAGSSAVATSFLTNIKNANKVTENFSPNVFVLKNESFLDKYTAKEKMLWGALIAFILFAIAIIGVLVMNMQSTQSELNKKNQELNSKQTEIQNAQTQAENAKREADKKKAEEEYNNQTITGSSADGFSLSMIDKIKLEAMEDPNVKADVIANKYLIIRFWSLKPEIGQKLTVTFNNWRAPLNYIISKSITGLAEGYNGIVQVIEEEANKTGQNKQFIIITDGNNNFFRANP